jgi:hypothetical protein
LETVVFTVEEIDLVCQLGNRFLICLVGVLHTEHFEALATLVKLLETFDLIFSHIDLLLYLLEFVFNLTLFAVKVL